MASSSLYQVDWSSCLIYQEQTNEPLQCPAKSKRDNVRAGYRSLAQNVSAFKDLGIILPITNLSSDDDSLETSLLNNKASWHKSCRNRFNNTKLKRAQKRKNTEDDADNREQLPMSKRAKRSGSSDSLPLPNKSSNDKCICFFCD